MRGLQHCRGALRCAQYYLYPEKPLLHVRLVEVMFLCEVSSTAEVLSGARSPSSVLKGPLACALATSGLTPSPEAKESTLLNLAPIVVPLYM